MHTAMDWWTKVRLEVLRGEKKKREVLRSEGIGWDTLRKILAHPEPPGYRLKEPRLKLTIGPRWSGSLKLSKRIKRYRRNNAIRQADL